MPGLVLGVMLGLAVVVLRGRMSKRGAAEVHRERVHRVLREHWAVLAGEIVARMQIPRVAAGDVAEVRR
ncbi:hypothetical protein CWC39_10180 [Corynebacterium heidelbergense]|uniref:Uncharacterized protein n=1 Tax=Corynebacterium heidelbergense TaxID=2055947 RepID=A0A364V884_9CORY|nr:hypothetical protein CWC39_10180 [Corynebacterium heidelbergense]